MGKKIKKLVIKIEIPNNLNFENTALEIKFVPKEYVQSEAIQKLIKEMRGDQQK